ncbi:MFS transporter [Kineococcus gynurae]|uniref:MFS transporter n=1 Tax=Kineococcus gynurae TaxID=452979 RepID=A0ABV5LW40_9ACTN
MSSPDAAPGTVPLQKTRAAHVATPGPAPTTMSHAQVLEALSGLLLGMFVAILSSTVVSNALPTIVPELGGSESGYTWVVTAALLATTISTPIWGKLSDLFSKKLLVQIALVLFVVASAVAGLSNSMGMLITTRVFQGIGGGGLIALAQVILATMVSPRERGRYSGYLGATFALATVGGPLIGGVLTQHLSWHWCFYVGIPFAIAAFFVLQFRLKLPASPPREVHIDYAGATLLAAGISALLIWVSLAGHNFDWWSWQTGALVGGGILVLAVAVLVESRSPEPIIPLRLFRSRTVSLSALASLFVGIAMFGATIFLSQYFQVARGETPTMAGLLTIPMIVGLFLSSTIAGQVITRTGRWKAWILSGGVLLTAGLGLMGTVEWDTEYWIVAVYMALVGLGVGMMMQNLVLAVQNVTDPRDLGSASSLIAFTRTLGGAIGVSALGAVLAHRVEHYAVEGLQAVGAPAGSLDTRGVPQVGTLPDGIREVVQSAYGSGIADVFLIAAPFALLALVIAVFFKEVALRGTTGAAPEDSVAGDPASPIADDAPASRRSDADLTLSGTVRLPDSRPLAGAVVTLADQTGRQMSRTATGTEGTYRLGLPTGGTYLLIVAAAHAAPTARLVAVGSTDVALDVTLSGRSAITGRVLARRSGSGDGPDTEGLGGALVTLTDVTGEVIGAVRTDDDGTYHFDKLMAGGYVLTAQSGRHRPVAKGIEVPEAGALAADLQLSGGGRLDGTVVAASDGRRLPEATVTLLDVDGQVVAAGRSDQEGHYAFDDLAAGRYTLTVAGYAPVVSTVDVLEDTVTRETVALGEARPERAEVGAAR